MHGRNVYFYGKLAGSNRRDAQVAAKAEGARIAKQLDETVDMVVLGEAELLASDWTFLNESLDEATRTAFEEGRLKIVTESQFWENFIEKHEPGNEPPAYTPAMLAELVGVGVATIRLWHRRGFIVPVKMVRKLPYFGFQEVLTAKVLRDLISSGLSPATISDRIESLRRIVPNVDRPLAQLAVIVEGKNLLVRQNGVLVDQRGQQRFDFDTGEELYSFTEPDPEPVDPFLQGIDRAFTPSGESIYETAIALEESGRFEEALDTYRAVLLSGLSDPSVHFQMAELLYRLGDLSAARERYFMAIELDEDYVEARANLGCVLAEQGRLDLAVEAFRGALEYHPDYADVHYHLGTILKRLGKEDEGESHLRIFKNLVPNSPWNENTE